MSQCGLMRMMFMFECPIRLVVESGATAFHRTSLITLIKKGVDCIRLDLILMMSGQEKWRLRKPVKWASTQRSWIKNHIITGFECLIFVSEFLHFFSFSLCLSFFFFLKVDALDLFWTLLSRAGCSFGALAMYISFIKITGCYGGLALLLSFAMRALNGMLFSDFVSWMAVGGDGASSSKQPRLDLDFPQLVERTVSVAWRLGKANRGRRKSQWRRSERSVRHFGSMYRPKLLYPQSRTESKERAVEKKVKHFLLS